jgi:hypothetical protein
MRWTLLQADGLNHIYGSIVYRLGRDPFKVERRVRFPLELLDSRESAQDAGVGGVGGRSSVWLEHSTVTREVAGSSPVAPVVVRAQQVQVAGCRRRTHKLGRKPSPSLWW